MSIQKGGALPKRQSWQEVAKRTVALGFAAVYAYTHSSPRDSSLRVAYLAYRFMDGDDVAQINAEADHENAAREAKEHVKHHVIEHRVVKIFRFFERKY